MSKDGPKLPRASETILPKPPENPPVDFSLLDNDFFEVPDFDTDPETETDDITEEVAQRMARSFAAQRPQPPSKPPPSTSQTILARETLSADIVMALETVHPADREALLAALTMEMRPEDFATDAATILPAPLGKRARAPTMPALPGKPLPGKPLPGSAPAAAAGSPVPGASTPPAHTVLAFDDLDDSNTVAPRGGVVSTFAKDELPGFRPSSPAPDPVSAPTMMLVNHKGNQMAIDPGEGTGTASDPTAVRGARMVDLGLIGVGGMGEVRRIFDRSLKRVLAVKIIRAELMNHERIVSRFISEAQATGQLQHPGIVPVHEVGRLDDGRYYFTMREIRGRDLSRLLRDTHAERDTLDDTGNAWSLRRLVDAFLKVCEAVAYAHSRNVIHRDLKPENILVGDYGEVLVVDWGIARVMHEGSVDDDALDGDIVTSRSKDERQQTVIGSVTGTPAYMPVEQAAGDREAQGPWSDVYALGAILYELLGGRQPYAHLRGRKILRALLAGPPEPLSDDSSIPEGLRAICNTAMSRDPAERYPSAAELVEVISAWLDGAQRRDEADLLMRRAEAKRNEVARLRARAAALHKDATELLDATDAAAPVHEKEPAWSVLEQAERLERGADMLEVTLTFNVRAALERFPDLEDGHKLLSEVYRRRLETAERSSDPLSAERNLTMLRSHSRGGDQGYLSGEGAVTLVTDPPGAEVQIFHYVERGRRSALEPFGTPLFTPLQAVELPMGSYLLSITKDGRVPVRYPVSIGRGDHADGRPPGASSPAPVYLPLAHEVPPGNIYIPQGWFLLGGDHRAPNAVDRQRVWVDGLIMAMYPVTHLEYLPFLQYLLKSYREEEAVAYAPPWSERGHKRGQPGFIRDHHGNFGLPRDSAGASVGADLPVMRIDWNAAMAYAHWLAEDQQLPWRLPHEVEWEKAARGADARAFTMGPYLDPTWACMGESHTSLVLPAGVDDYADDASVYGARGLTGNARDWCRNQYSTRDLDIVDRRLEPERIRPQSSGPVYRSTRGGAWGATVDECRAAARSRRLQDDAPSDVTVRLVRSFPR